MKIGKVLVIGSGTIKIAEAAEFDYSGSQALKALKEEKVRSILLNPNVATVQTSYKMADKVYMMPITRRFAVEVIKKERPDAIMIGFGGQNALDLGMKLHKDGILKEYGIRILGTPIEGVEKALSRNKFAQSMREHGIETPPSVIARNESEAIDAADKLGYPLIIRVSFNLGGRGSAIVRNQAQLLQSLKRAFSNSGSGEILVERYLEGWKEVEYEVVRDRFGNCAVVACIENLDPMGVHTGDSVAITPAQTLDNYEYQEMRSKAIEVACAIGLVGECNVQFALDTKSYKYYVIETNPRMSRSSALASKATGYPLAYVSAKLALGHSIYEITNSVSKKTTAMFEPSLDYVAVKAPRWDFEKFEDSDPRISSEMRSIGEAMGIGRSFEEALQKSARMLCIDKRGLFGDIYDSKISNAEIGKKLAGNAPYWQFYVAKAFKDKMPLEKVHKLTMIDKFYLEKIKNLVLDYETLKNKKLLDKNDLKKLSGKGFVSSQLKGKFEGACAVKQIDTLAGEVPARTDYLYTTQSDYDDTKPDKNSNSLLIIGAGVFRIGVSVEFDWSCMSLLDSAKKHFDRVAILNYNPETVSTDWDTVNELYFDEISYEKIRSICTRMNFKNIVTFAGGQLGNDISDEMSDKKINVFGTRKESVGIAEDRSKFSKLVDRLGIDQPEWMYVKSAREAQAFADLAGFPLLVRPSHVLGGSAIKIARSSKQLQEFFEVAGRQSRGYPVVLSKHIDGIEAEIDGAADGKNIIGITSYQIEEAGIHSGDSTAITPFYDSLTKKKMESISLAMVNELGIKGPFNMQFILAGGKQYVEELNLRCSRSMPFSSKSVGIDLVDYAVKGIVGRFDFKGFFEPKHNCFAVKTPQFVWSQMAGCYPSLGPDMRSTGESAALGKNLGDALVKSWLGARPNKIPARNALVYGTSNLELLDKTAKELGKNIKVCTIESAQIKGADSITQRKAQNMLLERKIDAVFTDGYAKDMDYIIRRAAADMIIPLVLNARLGSEISKVLYNQKVSYDEMREYWH